YIRDTTGGSLSFGFPLFEEFKAGLTYTYQKVDISLPSGTTLPPVNNTIFPGLDLLQSDPHESRLGPSIIRSTLNNPTDPTRGTRLIFANDIVGGFLGGDVSYYKPSLGWTHYIRGFSKKHYFAYNLTTGWGTGFAGQVLPFYERYYLGGERSIRG